MKFGRIFAVGALVLLTCVGATAQETSEDATTEVVTNNYPDNFADATINVTSDVAYTLSQVSILAENLESKTVRKTILRDGKMYVLALDESNEPYIYLVDLTGNTVTELDKAAVTLGANGQLKISDITLSVDGVLIASGLSKTQYNNSYVADGEVRGTVNVYKWTKDETTGLPKTCELWFTSQYSSNYYVGYIGKSITYTGTIADGILLATAVRDETGTMRVVEFHITDGALVQTMRMADGSGDLKTSNLSSNDDYMLSTSPLSDENFVFDGNLCPPYEIEIVGDGKNMTILGTASAVDKAASGISFFRMAGNAYMVSPAIDSDGLASGVELYDITDGFDAAELVTSQSLDTPVSYTYASAHAAVVPNDDNTKVELKLYLVAQATDDPNKLLVNDWVSEQLSCEIQADSDDTVTAIETVGVDTNAPAEYYNMQGVKVENPLGGIFIKRQGSKAVKVVL